MVWEQYFQVSQLNLFTHFFRQFPSTDSYRPTLPANTCNPRVNDEYFSIQSLLFGTSYPKHYRSNSCCALDFVACICGRPTFFCYVSIILAWECDLSLQALKPAVISAIRRNHHNHFYSSSFRKTRKRKKQNAKCTRNKYSEAFFSVVYKQNQISSTLLGNVNYMHYIFMQWSWMGQLGLGRQYTTQR